MLALILAELAMIQGDTSLTDAWLDRARESTKAYEEGGKELVRACMRRALKVGAVSHHAMARQGVKFYKEVFERYQKLNQTYELLRGWTASGDR